MEENKMMDSQVAESTEEMVSSNANGLTEMMKNTTGVGWKYAVFLVATVIFQFIYGMVIPARFYGQSWVTFLQIIIPMHILGFGLLLLMTAKMPTVKLEKKKLGFGKFIVCVLIGAGICLVGMLVGLGVHKLVLLPFDGGSLGNAGVLDDLMMGTDAFWRILTVGICAPIVEELIFRKLLIDRVLKYGEFLAIILSGLMFGIFHGNFQQMFFAMGLGMFWAFIYIRTGKVWYTIALHMVINLTTSVITVYLTQWALSYMSYVEDPNYAVNLANGEQGAVMATITNMVVSAWIGFLGLVALTGIILFFVNKKKFKLNPSPYGITKGEMFGKGVFNWGMILFWLACSALLTINYINYSGILYK